MVKRRKTRKKKGGSDCKNFNNNCAVCVSNADPQCVFNRESKVCSKETFRKKMRNKWMKTCNGSDLPEAEIVAAIVNPLRQTSPGGTQYVNADGVDDLRTPSEQKRGESKTVPFVPYANNNDEDDETNRQKREKRERRRRRNERITGLLTRNGVVNDKSNLEGTPCITQCEHKGWCEKGSKFCDWENYCYPSNRNGDGKLQVDQGDEIDIVYGDSEKQYCDKPNNRGGRRKSRRRKSRRRKSRRRKSRRRKSRGRKSRRRKSRRRKSRRRKSRRRKSRRRKSRRRKSRRRKSRRRKSRGRKSRGRKSRRRKSRRRKSRRRKSRRRKSRRRKSRRRKSRRRKSRGRKSRGRKSRRRKSRRRKRTRKRED